MVQINKVCQGVFLTHSFLGYKVRRLWPWRYLSDQNDRGKLPSKIIQRRLKSQYFFFVEVCFFAALLRF